MIRWRNLFGKQRQAGAVAAESKKLVTDELNLAALSAPTLLDFDALHRRAEASREAYQEAQPFPHILLDEFLPAPAVATVVAEFPDPDAQLEWRRVDLTSSSGDLVQDGKMGFAAVDQLGPSIRELLHELNSGTFLRFLEKLTGIEGLIADPMLQGGGIHQVLPGGMLAVHADFTNHPRFNLDRRLNVLLYLNEDWPVEYGGELELWSPDMSRCERRIRPLAGRCVIFNTSQQSYHGHPRPLSCPSGQTRKSIALYFYTQGREDADVEPTELTSWRRVPDASLPVPE